MVNSMGLGEECVWNEKGKGGELGHRDIYFIETFSHPHLHIAPVLAGGRGCKDASHKIFYF
jgi:hypothetical protein